MPYKTGRLPRRFDPRVPHLSALRLMKTVRLPQLLPQWDWAARLPTDLGAMLNTSLGDCTCAALGHAEQVWTAYAQGQMMTPSDAQIEALYERFGYSPADPESDRGAVEQDVLTSALNVGIPMPDGTMSRITAFFEVDPRNTDDLCEVVQEFGLAYIGFSVPSGFMDAGPAKVWDVSPSFGQIEGGHAVILTGFDRSDPANPTFNVVSWGERDWTMTTAFVRQYVDEAYAISSDLWIERTGKTPYGLTPEALAALGSALREP